MIISQWVVEWIEYTWINPILNYGKNRSVVRRILSIYPSPSFSQLSTLKRNAKKEVVDTAIKEVLRVLYQLIYIWKQLSTSSHIHGKSIHPCTIAGKTDDSKQALINHIIRRLYLCVHNEFNLAYTNR